MERRKALLAATIGAATLVAGSFAYAATNLATAPPDNVGKLQDTLSRPVQVVYDDVLLPTVDASGTAPVLGSTDSAIDALVTPSAATDRSVSRDDTAPGGALTAGTNDADDDEPPSTLGGSPASDDSDDRYESDEPEDRDEPYPEDTEDAEHEEHEEYEDD